MVSVDPGDMDTPLHALAVPDADRSTLKHPDTAAREIAEQIATLTSRAQTAAEFGYPAEAGLYRVEAAR